MVWRKRKVKLIRGCYDQQQHSSPAEGEIICQTLRGFLGNRNLSSDLFDNRAGECWAIREQQGCDVGKQALRIKGGGRQRHSQRELVHTEATEQHPEQQKRRVLFTYSPDLRVAVKINRED